MKIEHRGDTRTWPRLFGAIILILNLGGCVSLPPVLHYASMAVSGISYVATGKGPSDHALSIAARKDCSLLRALAIKPICIPVHADTNKPVWTRLLRKMEDPFPDDNVPMPPRLFIPNEKQVVQTD